jgi:hypothetical protein
VSTLVASRWDASTAYAVADAHRLDDETPYLFKTSDLGRTWTSLTTGLDPEIYLHVVREDSRRRGMLFLGTERGVMVSRDDGASWHSLRLNMPTVAVVDLAVAGDDLVVGTLGRSAWILDDLTPVREMSPEIAAAPAHLFAPLPTVQWRYRRAPYGSDAGAGQNPPKGASITYHLASKAEGEATLEILDSSQQVVRRLSSELRPVYTPPEHPDWNPKSDPKPELEVEAGFHRATWDLRHEGAEWVPGSRVDTGDPGPGPFVVPGDYTLRLTVDGATFTESLRVEPDPRITTSGADLEAQLAFVLGIRDRLTRISEMAVTIRGVREQLEDRNARLAGDPEAAPVVEKGAALIAGLTEVEEAIHNPQAEVGYDILAGRRGGAKLYSRLAWLMLCAADHNGPPTQGMLEVGDELGAELEAQEEALARLLSVELTNLNLLAAERSIPYVVRAKTDGR